MRGGAIATVSDIRARPDAAHEVGEWLSEEWSQLPIHDYLDTVPRGNEPDEALPRVLIAERKGEIVGTASLLGEDMETRPGLGPWLGCVYVRSDQRGNGIGTLLIERAEALAESLGIRTLHLFTDDCTGLYTKLGWSAVEQADYEGKPVTIMKKVVAKARFSWRVFDVEDLLPSGWREELLDLAVDQATQRTLQPRSVTSREGDPDLRLPVITVGGRVLTERVPWLATLYRGWFREYAATCSNETVMTAVDDRYGINLNVQRGRRMRYECHVDSNPIEGLLYVTDHPRGSGGELVAANRRGVSSVKEVDEDCSVLHPEAGKLVFFDAREFAHYVRPLRDDDAVRAVVAMNFYTPASPESARPADLNEHLFGEKTQVAMMGRMDDRERAARH